MWGSASGAGHRATQLSGGEMQRVAIARALANRPALLLADEPTGELDRETGQEILDLFGRINRDGATLVVVTHDDRLAAEASRVIHMQDGRIVEGINEAARAGRAVGAPKRRVSASPAIGCPTSGRTLQRRGGAPTAGQRASPR